MHPAHENQRYFKPKSHFERRQIRNKSTLRFVTVHRPDNYRSFGVPYDIEMLDGSF